MSDAQAPVAPRLLTADEVKVNIIQNAAQLHKQLCDFIKRLPIDSMISAYAIQNIDQGIMWVEQGIKALNFEVTKPAVQPTGETSDEIKKETSSEEGSQESGSEESSEPQQEVGTEADAPQAG